MPKKKRARVPSARKANGVEKTWEIQERVVALIEKAISPDATVRRNVMLKSTGSGVMRQCDVVIETGRHPRVTTSIVEVQKRKSRVKINDFLGWVEKMRRVGAGYLICVSELPFPKSVIQEAESMVGPQVKLVTLADLAATDAPIDIDGGCFNVRSPLIGISTTKPIVVESTPPVVAGELSRSEKVFRIDGHPCSLEQVLEWTATQNKEDWLEQIQSDEPFVLTGDGGRMEMVVGGVVHCVVNICLWLDVKWQTTLNVPIQFSSYKHHDETNATAWVATGNYTKNGREVAVRAVYVPDGNGRFRVKVVDAIGMRGCVLQVSEPGEETKYHFAANPTED